MVAHRQKEKGCSYFARGLSFSSNSFSNNNWSGFCHHRDQESIVHSLMPTKEYICFCWMAFGNQMRVYISMRHSHAQCADALYM